MNGYLTFAPQKAFFSLFFKHKKERQKKHLKCTYSLSFEQKTVVCFFLAPRKPEWTSHNYFTDNCKLVQD